MNSIQPSLVPALSDHSIAIRPECALPRPAVIRTTSGDSFGESLQNRLGFHTGQLIAPGLGVTVGWSLPRWFQPSS